MTAGAGGSDHRSRLLLAIEGRQARVGIIGLGYVGLPLARAFAVAGYRVLGFDTDPAKVEKLARGQSYIGHIADESVASMVAGGFEATDRFERLGEPDAIIICVPTPLTEARDPDLGYVVASARAIAETLRPGQLVVLESTTYPGTTRNVVLPILEAGGLRAGSDFFLAFSPEREDPGNPTYSAPTIPKVVGGLDPPSLEVAEGGFYGRVVVRVVPVSTPEVAEACKILENTYRAVNIALVNELKILFDRMGIDVWEVIDAAKTKPFGFQAFYPGPGLGGHCIPIDPFYLSWVARKHGFTTRFIELAGEINTSMPAHVVRKVADAAQRSGPGAEGEQDPPPGDGVQEGRRRPPRVAGLRVDGPAPGEGGRGRVQRPHIPSLPSMRKYPHLKRESQPLSSEYLASRDCVLIVTDHSAYDWGWIVGQARLVVDTRNATRGVAAEPGKVVRA